MLFPPFEGDPAQLPALTLAYIGDAVYELHVRRGLLDEKGLKAHELHRKAIKKVNAGAQARLIIELQDELTEIELAVAKRGRNAKSGQVPKNADVGEYRWSTGMEALIGYLFLKGQWDRIEELLDKISKRGM